MENKSDYCLYIWPNTYNIFIDIAKALKWNLEQQGNTVVISEDLVTNAINTVIFGANESIYNNFSIHIPKEAIIYNFEQLYDGCRWDNPRYLNILKDREIWDYSVFNINWLQKKGLGKLIKHMKIKYAPTLEFKFENFPDFEDIDILFIGSMNERRQFIFDQLQKVAPHLNIIFRNNVWGIDKNELIARSKIILNIHYYLTGILETPRISQVVANDKFIISELSNADDQADWPGIVFVPYNELVNTVLHYSQQPNECMNLAKKSYEYFKLSGFNSDKS